jgi:hypothetical protein
MSAPEPRGWIQHDGKGMPIPRGSTVDMRLFNGDVLLGVKCGTVAFGNDGTVYETTVKPIYSVWWYDDGGPMAPKCRAYRLHTNEAKRERSTEMFRSWLDVRERESV